MLVKLPSTAGARPDQMNMTFSPSESNCFLLPDRNPSPTPTSSNKDPTPQAIPNMVKNERSLCAQSVRRVWPKISNSTRMEEFHDTAKPLPALRIDQQKKRYPERWCCS